MPQAVAPARLEPLRSAPHAPKWLPQEGRVLWRRVAPADGQTSRSLRNPAAVTSQTEQTFVRVAYLSEITPPKVQIPSPRLGRSCPPDAGRLPHQRAFSPGESPTLRVRVPRSAPSYRECLLSMG